MTSLSTPLADVLSQHLGRPTSVEKLRRLAGGSSHETWAFDAVDSQTRRTPLILRREFERGLLNTDVRSEFELLVALHAAGVAVPEPVLCQDEGSALDLPFMVLTQVDGTDLRKDLAHAEGDRDTQGLARAAVELQAAIHAVPVGILSSMPGFEVNHGPAHELGRWTKVLEEAKTPLDPLLATALTWLRVREPQPVAPVLVHGDFKANNLLVDSSGSLSVIDWEMSHLGDPVEDLAWTMLWRTSWDVVGGLHPAPADYLAAYTELTGRQVDAWVLEWWRLFALVKLWAIFATGMAVPDARPTLRLMGRSTIWLAEQVAAHLLNASATHEVSP